MQDSKLGKPGRILAAGQRDDLEGARIAADEIERAFADGAGGAKDGDSPWLLGRGARRSVGVCLCG
jgi:hypothetical protein